jgi:Ca-activated chloride channel homolog
MEAVKDTTRLDTVKVWPGRGRIPESTWNLRPGNDQWNFNLAGAQYKQMQFEEAEQKFEELAEKFETPEEQARALHNIGNSQLDAATN